MKPRRSIALHQHRGGFTLMELLLALVLTTVVALLVYGTVQVGFDTRERLSESLRERQRTRAVRALMEDALRNLRESAGPGDSVFMLAAGTDSRGRPADRLLFVTGGGLPPISHDTDWIVTIEPTAEGLRVSGLPIGVVSTPRVLALLPSVTGLEVFLLGSNTTDQWSRAWPNPALLPRGVRVSFLSDSGAVMAPVHVTLALGGRS